MDDYFSCFDSAILGFSCMLFCSPQWRCLIYIGLVYKHGVAPRKITAWCSSIIAKGFVYPLKSRRASKSDTQHRKGTCNCKCFFHGLRRWRKQSISCRQVQAVTPWGRGFPIPKPSADTRTGGKTPPTVKIDLQGSPPSRAMGERTRRMRG